MSAGVPSDTPTVRVDPTDSRARPAAAATSARNVSFVECATTTPICGQAWTTAPSALATALASTWVCPGLAIRAFSR